MNLNINSAWSATSAVLKSTFSFYDIKEIVGLAGFDTSMIAHLVQSSGSSVSKGQLISEIERGLNNFNNEEKQHFLNIVVEEMLTRRSDTEEQLENYLSRLGWQVIENKVIPIDILDRNDLEELDDNCKDDLVKSAIRYRDGDLSGALSSACAAVDSLTTKIYQNFDLGDAAKASFQERCKVSLTKVGVFSSVENELRDIEWKESGIIPFGKNFEGAINQAAYIMQTLRANMADVHGTKPVFRPLVFDSIKWSQILVRLLSGQYNA
ncbi:MAG: hypothetical protein CTY16_05940 [Methylobacter sp.]|nr:MAG: hypothetical protein CTY16_05940 [Methylobacter sp.]